MEVLTTAKSLDLSSDLCRHRVCLLKPTTPLHSQSYSTAKNVTMKFGLQKASVFLPIFFATGTAWCLLIKPYDYIGAANTYYHDTALQKASIFLPIFVPTGTACSNPLLAKSYLTVNFAAGKRSTCHYSTCVAKSQCLGLSSDLGHRWGCLLIPTAKSYSTANYAKTAKQCKPP